MVPPPAKRTLPQGNGLTVERDKVEIYAELANLMFKNLFGEELVQHATPATELLGEFMATWVSIERVIYRIADLTYPDRREGKWINIGHIPRILARDKTLDKPLASEIDQLRQIKNQIIHGVTDHKSILTADLIKNMQSVLTSLENKLSAWRRMRIKNDQLITIASTRSPKKLAPGDARVPEAMRASGTPG